MKKIILFVALLVLFSNATPQEIKDHSGEYSFHITKGQPKPPFLEIETSSIVLTDKDGNHAINAGETATLSFLLKNTGMGDGRGLKLNIVETTGATGLYFDKNKTLDNLKTGENLQIELQIDGSMDIKNGKAVFRITAEEPNGFDSDPLVVELVTMAFMAPDLKIADYAVQSSTGTMIKKT